jgi:HEAT repeat protein
MQLTILAVLILCSWFQPVRADESHTFYGKTVEGWIAVLRDKTGTAERRRQAAWALAYFGQEANAAIPELIDAAREKRLQAAATEALARIRRADAVNVPELIAQFLKRGCEHLTGQGFFMYDASVDHALVRIDGPAVPALVDILNGPNWDMRVCAAHVLSMIGPPARSAVPSLIRAIEHPDPHDTVTLALYAVRALGRIGPDAKPAIPSLNGLYGKNLIDDFDIVIALDGIGDPPVSRLVDTLLRDNDSYAAYQLSWLGPKAREAVPALRAALTDRRLQCRFSAAVALASIDPSVTASIPVLNEALKYLNDDEIDISDVPIALAHLGPKAKEAVPTLINLVKKGCDDTSLLTALVQIDPIGEECVPTLISALKQEDYRAVDVAARCLGLLGPHAKNAVPCLAEVVTRDFEDDGNVGVSNPQVSAAKALARIGVPAISALPALATALNYRRVIRTSADGVAADGERVDCSAAAAAADVLGSFGPMAKAAVPFLIQAVKTQEPDDNNEQARKAAILALGRIGPDANAAIPVLRNLATDVRTRHYLPELLIALYQLDPDGKPVAERWLENPDIPFGTMAPERRLERRVIVLGAMGRATFEGDWLTRRFLERLDSSIGHLDPRDGDESDYLEEWLERLSRLGPSARLAVPRLQEFRKHPNPWIRMWASEALIRIVPDESMIPAAPRKSEPLMSGPLPKN